MAEIRIGISGWRYRPWRGDFYPPGLKHRDELQFASRTVGSIEINGSFYALQRPESYAAWYAATPADFVFSLKAPRYITHIRRLREIESGLANFFASGLFLLGEKLGPLLWQLPRSLAFDPVLFEAFLQQLPHDTQAALQLAQHCDAKVQGRTYLQIDRPRPLRHAVEIRHDSFLDEAFVALLRRYRVALVIADSASHWPYREDLCSDFVYLRLHGDEALYSSGYSEAALRRWSQRIRCWAEGGQPEDAQLISREPPPAGQSRAVYCYFDNDSKVRAPYDARRLLELLGLDHTLTETPGVAPQTVWHRAP